MDPRFFKNKTGITAAGGLKGIAMNYHTLKDNTIRHIFISLLGVFLLCVLACASAQDIPATDKSGDIVIVPTLDKYRNIRRLKEKDLGGYLMVYFKDETQSAYMAVSRDGYTFTDLNNSKPIFKGEVLAEQKGVRDPHITRGPTEHFTWP